ncbi:TonB-dependent receptor [Pelomonas sp. SE-A7]|uniref:TonB-dependent receptor n=1 Tax=Pelomonas sp. SE-A7 TaxID=3054953 RepID=UPI00259D167B|nr:TonB-dependent receptor [Pelomonas sp. SE-A7]MDM4767459.1 TonB-dependent receptor [Pelomonas sp. SE-A7]
MHQRFARTPCALAILLLSLGAAQAQTQAPAPQAAAPEEVKSLGVVEVTGQSRVQQLRDVPITISVVGADKIKSVGAANIGALDGLMPGLTVDASQPTQPNYAMRGIGTGDFGIGTDAPVGLYIDGIYAGKTGGALLTFNDVKRIEVLKGPQGTLFGRNAAGGAVSIITNDPSQKREASGLLRLGNQGQYHGELLYNTPLNDNTALRFSAVREHDDGWVTNSINGRKEGGANGWGTKLALKWADADSSALLSWEHEVLNQPARPLFAVVSKPDFTGSAATWKDPRTLKLANDADPNIESRKFDGLTLKISHSLAIGELTSTTGYRRFNAQDVQDNDGSAIKYAYLSTGNYEGSRSWQQEFRLNGSNDSIDWVAGVSAFHEKADQQTALFSATDTIDTIMAGASGGLLAPYATVNQLAGMFGIPGVNVVGLPWTESMFNTISSRAAAVFGDVIWKLTPSTNLTTGIRFTRDSKRFSWHNPVRTAPQLDATLKALGPPTTGGFFDGVNANQPLIAASMGLSDAQLRGALQANGLPPQLGYALYGLMTTNVNFNSPAATAAPMYDSASWTNTSPRLVLDHRLDKDTMLFASATRGYQAGGFNAIYKQGVAAFGPETVTNLEAGVKGNVRSTGLFYTAALFHYDFNNLQSIGTTKSSSGVTTYVVNVSDQKATGLDLEAYWQIDRTWRLSGAAEFIDQVYKRYSYSPGAGVVFNMAGQPAGTPRMTATLGLDARFGLADGQATASLNWAYSGAQRCNDETRNRNTCGQLPAFAVGEATNRVNLRLGWEAPSKTWGLGLLVNNLLDKQYVSYMSAPSFATGTPAAYISAPRKMSLELNFKL